MKVNVFTAINSHRKAIIVFTVIILAGGIGTAAFLTRANTAAAGEAVSYREYTVELGDITVGTNESGAVTLDSKSVTFPVAATVDEVLVKTGYAVKAGDVLLRLDPDSVSEGAADTQSQLAEQKAALDQAIANQKTSLAAAKLAYDNSISTGNYAQTTNELTKTELQTSLTDAQNALTKAQAELADYQALQTTFPADSTALTDLKQQVADAKDQMEAAEKTLSDYIADKETTLDRYDSLLAARNNTKAELDAAEVKLDEGYIDQDAYDEAEDAYDAADAVFDDFCTSSVKRVVSNRDDYEDAVEDCTERYNDLSEQYDDFYATYRDTYGLTTGNSSDAGLLSTLQEDFTDRLQTYEDAVASAQTNLTKFQMSYDKSVNAADQQLQSDLNATPAAQTT